VVIPLPIVTRAESLARLVRAVGWAGALEIGRGTWAGWEADFLRAALVVLAEADRGDTMMEQAALFRGLLGGGPTSDGP